MTDEQSHTKPGRAIAPDEVTAPAGRHLPDFVFDAFNSCIVANWTGNSAVVGQNKVIAAILSRAETTREEIFRCRWLDVESAYRATGWRVEYDKPGYNETYEPTFTFSKAK